MIKPEKLRRRHVYIRLGSQGRPLSLEGPLECRWEWGQPSDDTGGDHLKQKAQAAQDVCRSERRTLGHVSEPGERKSDRGPAGKRNGSDNKKYSSGGKATEGSWGEKWLTCYQLFRIHSELGNSTGKCEYTQEVQVSTVIRKKKTAQKTVGDRATVLSTALPGLCSELGDTALRHMPYSEHWRARNLIQKN